MYFVKSKDKENLIIDEGLILTLVQIFIVGSYDQAIIIGIKLLTFINNLCIS